MTVRGFVRSGELVFCDAREGTENCWRRGGRYAFFLFTRGRSQFSTLINMKQIVFHLIQLTGPGFSRFFRPRMIDIRAESSR